MKTMEEIRAEFPHPETLDRLGIGGFEPNTGRHYCVGGAVLAATQPLMYGKKLRLKKIGCFPTARRLSRVLRADNPHLDGMTAVDIAEMITKLNDRGEFEDAWAWVDKALSYR